MNIDLALAITLLDLRRKAKLTQSEAAESVGLVRKTIWEIEHGLGGVKVSTVYKLSCLYGLPLDELMKRVTINMKDLTV